MSSTNVFSVVVPRKSEIELAELFEGLAKDPTVGQVVLVEDAPERELCQGAEDIRARSSKFQTVRLEKEKGPGHARNVGLARVSCPFVAFVDADDLVVPEYFRDAGHHIATFPRVDVFKFGHFVGDSQTAAMYVAPPLRGAWDQELEGRAQILPVGARTLVDQAYAWSCVYKTSFIRRNSVAFCETYSAEDYYFLWKTMLAGPLVRVLDQGWYLYRRGGGITSALDARNLTYTESFRQILGLAQVRENIGYRAKALRQFLAISAAHVEGCRMRQDPETERIVLDRSREVLLDVDLKTVNMVLAGLPREKSPVRSVLQQAGFYDEFALPSRRPLR